jgi:hypothetical protein
MMFRCLVVVLALASVISGVSAQAADLFNLERIQQATVFIAQVEGAQLTTRCVGSGVLVRPDGVILTNAHHTVPSATCPGDTLIISITLDPTQPPVPKYRAEIAQVDAGLDLALLRITREFDGRPINPTTFPLLPFVDQAPSSDVQLDQTVTFVGYTDLGNVPVRSIRGTVRGFIAEASGGERSWIKTSSVEPVSGIMTGGGVYNEAGQLVGIPTSAPTAAQVAGSNCIRLEDVNGDGIVNNDDACVPIGDDISVVRPSDFARPLIRSASFDLTIRDLTQTTAGETITERPRIARVFAAPSVVNDVPSTVVASLPAGTTSMYLFFDYFSMTPETVYEVRVTVDGIPNTTFSLPPVRWSGGRNGMWYIGSSGQPYPNGNYEYRIFIDGVAAASYTVAIGGPPPTAPAFSNVVFGILNPDGQLAGSGYVLPTGSIATARFIYSNMQPDLPWTVVWYYNNTQLVQTNDRWRLELGANGTQSISLQPQGGLPIGEYRVELYINNILSATGDFTIAGSQRAALPVIFSSVEFQRVNNAGELTGQPGTTFPDGAVSLQAQFNWQQMAPGTLWRVEWLVDDSPFFVREQPWSLSESGQGYRMQLISRGGIPDGTYTVRLYVAGLLVESRTVTVGIGQLRIDRFAVPTGVTLRGRILDYESQTGIEGVTFVLISTDFSVADFRWEQSQIFALAITDRNGNFQIDRPLQYDAPYSVLVSAAGYLPLSVDGFSLSPDDPNPLEMLITLVRD